MRSMILLAAAFILACGSSSPAPTEPSPPAPGGNLSGASGGCIKTGCSGTVCAEPGQDVVTTCEYRPEYACYQKATCERQGGGACSWTQTPELTACLANPPAM